MQIPYYEYLKDVKNTYLARNRLLDVLKKNKWNIKKTAKDMKVSKTTVKKVKRLYQEYGLKGLKDKRQGPIKQWKKIRAIFHTIATPKMI